MSQDDDEWTSQDDDEDIDEESPQFIELVNRLLHLCEERWGRFGDVPEAWWNPSNFIRNSPYAVNRTEDEIHRAAERAFEMFYEDNPEAVADAYAYHQAQRLYIFQDIEEIINDVIDSVTSIIFGGVPGGPGHGKSPS